jgi:hypothetical protein
MHPGRTPPVVASASVDMSKPFAVVSFGGASYLEVQSSASLDVGATVDFTVVIVFSAGDNPLFGGIVAHEAADFHTPLAGWQLFGRSGTGTVGQEIRGLGAGFDQPESSLVVDDGVFRILTTIFHRATSTVDVFANGAAVESAVAPNLGKSLSTTDPLLVGSDRLRFAIFKGKLAELRVYHEALSAPLRASIETVLSARYKIPTLQNPTP